MEETIYFIRQEYIKRFYPELWEEARNLDYDDLKKLVQEVMKNGTQNKRTNNKGAQIL